MDKREPKKRVLSGSGQIFKREHRRVASPVLRRPPSRRQLRPRKSKLDLIDNKNLTFFPQIGAKTSNESIRIVEDYIPVSGSESKEQPPPSGATGHCNECAKTIGIHSHFLNKTVFCEACEPAGDVLRVDKDPFVPEPYFVCDQQEWYTTLRKTFRWRWRIKGLIPP